MPLDHAEHLSHVAVLDIAPTLTMYERTDQQFAARYFWWFFLIQPAPLPERLIEANPEFFLRTHLTAQSRPAAVWAATHSSYRRFAGSPLLREFRSRVRRFAISKPSNLPTVPAQNVKTPIRTSTARRVSPFEWPIHAYQHDELTRAAPRKSAAMPQPQ
jgi:hypothetical protein